MAVILNIDTSTSFCSVSLSKDGETLSGFESSNKMDHSVSSGPFVEKCIEFARSHNLSLDAVSVAYGPGSYTGVRIGLSLAKGLAYGLDIPLISISSLEIMAVRALFSYPRITGEELIIPMIDARRMEVFAGAYDCGLNSIIEEQPMILDEDSFKDIKERPGRVIFVGDGVSKFKDIYSGDAIWMKDIMPHAKYMPALADKYFREKKFSDIAYTVPNYLKDYMATQPKNRL